jgi:hypothetical protein
MADAFKNFITIGIPLSTTNVPHLAGIHGVNITLSCSAANRSPSPQSNGVKPVTIYALALDAD